MYHYYTFKINTLDLLKIYILLIWKAELQREGRGRWKERDFLSTDQIPKWPQLPRLGQDKGRNLKCHLDIPFDWKVTNHLGYPLFPLKMHL